MFDISKLKLAMFVLIAAVPFGASAQDKYPARDIHILNGYVAGSGADVIVRYYADKLQKLAGRSIIVENKPGASGNIAMEAAARAKPDGYTLLLSGGSSIASSPSLFKNLSVNPGKDFAAVTSLLKFPFVLTVSPKSPAMSVAELTKLMKEKKGHGLYAGVSPTGIVSAELYKSVTGLQTEYVNYKTTAPAIVDMTDGSVDWMFMDPIAAIEAMRQGRIRGLAVTTLERAQSMPDLPSLKEAGVEGVEMVSWWMVAAPSGTPRPIVDQISTWFNQITSTDETEKFISRVVGGEPFLGNPDVTQKFFETEILRWREYIKTAKIEPQG